MYLCNLSLELLLNHKDFQVRVRLKDLFKIETYFFYNNSQLNLLNILKQIK